MKLHTHNYDFIQKLQVSITDRYCVDETLAQEMAIDFLELLTALDSNLEILEKYYLH